MSDVTLRWEDPEDAGEFLRLREQLRSHGWLPDPAGDALRELVSGSEVVTRTDEDGPEDLTLLAAEKPVCPKCGTRGCLEDAESLHW